MACSKTDVTAISLAAGTAGSFKLDWCPYKSTTRSLSNQTANNRMCLGTYLAECVTQPLQCAVTKAKTLIWLVQQNTFPRMMLKQLLEQLKCCNARIPYKNDKDCNPAMC